MAESIQSYNKTNPNSQLLIKQTSKFFWHVHETIQTFSAWKNTFNTFWTAGDHNDPSSQNFSYNDLCRGNKATESLFLQVKLVLD